MSDLGATDEYVHHQLCGEIYMVDKAGDISG